MYIYFRHPERQATPPEVWVNRNSYRFQGEALMGKSRDNETVDHKTTPTEKPDPSRNNHPIHSPYYYAIILALLVFACEALIMAGLSFLPIGSARLQWLLDPLFLIFLLLPAFHFFLLRPLILHIKSRRQYEKKLDRLNLVLRAIRNVNQLITREKDRDRLLNDACIILTETRGYYNAWITLFDDSGDCQMISENGLGEDPLFLKNMPEQGDLTPCGRKAMEQAEPVRIEHPSSDCTGCPFAERYAGGAAMTIRLEHDGKIYGLLTVSTPPEFIGEEEEEELFREVAGDLAFALYSLDIDKERERAREALKQSEEKFSASFHGSHDAITLTTRDGKVIDCNQRTLEIFGLESKDDFRDKRPADFSPPFQPDGRSSKEASRKIINNVFRDGGFLKFEWVHQRKDGTIFPTEIIFKTIRLGGEEVLQANIRDITDRKRAEAQEQMLSVAIEQAGEMIVITDPEGTIQYVNPAFARITGYHRDEVLGQNPRILKSGKQDEVFYRNLWETISSGKTWHGRMVNKCKNGTLYTEESTISPVRNASGTVINYVAVKRDMSEYLQLESQLRQAQKMEAIGTLAGGIAHDFNNILGAIIGMSELALLEVKEGSSLHRHISQILKASDRAKNLVKQILAFSRQRKNEDIVLSIKPVIKEALKLLKSSFPANIEIKPYIETDPGLIKGDPTQIHQVLMNLCSNAEHAMRETGGILEVRLERLELEPGANELKGNPKLHKGPYVCLSVRDTGYGIPPELMGRIFDPYFTTKGVGEGTGLGLAVVQGIVDKHKGTLTVESKPGKGAVFRVFFPAIEGEREKISKKEQEKLPTGSERILFIDDEEALAEVGKGILEYLGYEVTVRTSSLEALELFKAKPEHFDMVITDMTMPNMTGAELSQELMKIRPNIPIILCTGFSHIISEEKAREIGIRAFVMKPLITKDLAETVRRVLDTNAAT